MEISGSFFSNEWLVAYGGVYAFAAYKAVRWADWGRLKENYQQHVYIGSMVFLLVLWSLRTEVEQGFVWHLSGMVSITLMFRASLAIIGASGVLLVITAMGLTDWAGFLPTAVIHIVMPALITSTVLALVRVYLPKNFFIYVFLNAFATAGILSIIAALLTIVALNLANPAAVAKLTDTYLTFLPLMFFPEAVLNGWIMSVLVGFQPTWVASFRDEEYLDGK